MHFDSIVDFHRSVEGAVDYKLTLVNLVMTIQIFEETHLLLEVIFEGVQSYSFIPDDLANYRDEIEFDTLQRAVEKTWIDDLRVPSDVHRRYLENHDLYVAHVTDIGQFEVVALSAHLNEPGRPSE